MNRLICARCKKTDLETRFYDYDSSWCAACRNQRRRDVDNEIYSTPEYKRMATLNNVEHLMYCQLDNLVNPIKWSRQWHTLYELATGRKYQGAK